VWALNTLKDEDEKIRVPGFYDNVVPPSERDKELAALLEDASAEYKERFAIKEFIKGVQGGVDLYLQEVFEPTATICGLTSGYQGAGTKTVLPAQASAKVDFRLVPDQTPEEILKGAHPS
jgi:acetylornithine deacetylase/succinyl-diaminopimelate desuccinylase-like protein